ncbi:MAG: hypothetical protein HND49_01390 [Planctomycetes bacterium]|nr:hypothetical protein [Planctomycetota bacterium]
MGGTVETTYKLFKQGLSIDEIAKSRNLTISTISGHIEALIRDGREIEMDRLLDAAKREEIEKLFEKLNTVNTSPIVEHFRGRVSYDEAKFVRAFMLRQAQT